MKFNKLRKDLVVLVGASIFLGSFSTASAEFTFLNTHPEASTVFLSTPWRGIREFTEYNDRLYMGYGANGATAAPGSCPPEDSYSGSFCDIKLRYLNPVNGIISTVQEEIRSQGMFTLNVHNGKLYALAEDPDPNEMLIRCTTSSCAPRYFNTPRSAHNFVSVEYQGAIYVGGGSNQGYGAIWKSTNNGVTWNEYKQTPKDNNIVCCARVAFMEVLNGSLYAQAYQYDSVDANDPAHNWQAQGIVYKLTGNTWTTFTSEFLPRETFARSAIFNGKIVYRVDSDLKTYDGTTQEFIYSPSIHDFYIDDGYLYVLETDGDVFQTENLSHWQPVENHSASARQLAVYGDTMFLGDKDGNIWVSNKTFPRPPIAYLPAVYYFLED